jgi:hypothetical protein
VPAQLRSLRGQSLVEFALILPILLLLLAGAIDLGRAYFSAITLENAVKEGAFWGARDPECATDATAGCTDPGNVEARIQAELDGLALTLLDVKCFNPGTTDFTGTGKPLADCEDGDLYFVRAQLPFALVTPIISSIVGSPITMSSDATAVVITSIGQLGGQVGFPSASPQPTPSPGSCTVPDFTLGPTKLNQARDVWSDNAGFVATNLTPVGPGGQGVSWQSLPGGTVGNCDTETIIVSNTVQGTTAPTPSPTPTATPTPNPSATATPTPTPTPTPAGNCTVPDMRQVVVTVAQAKWTQAGFQAQNFSAHRGPKDDYVVGSQNKNPGQVLPCLTATVQVKQ